MDTATGGYTSRHVLLQQNCPTGLNFTIEYSSALLNTGPLGVGWNHNFEIRVDEVAAGAVLIFNWHQNRRNNFNRVGAAGTYRTTDRLMRYDTLVKNADSTYKLTRADQSLMDFNAAGRLTKITNRNGQAITLDYGVGTVPLTIRDTISGKTMTLSYDTSSRVTSVTDGLARRIVFAYAGDADAMLAWAVTTQTTGTVDANFTYTYDTKGRILTAEDREGVVILKNTFDDRGRVVSQDDALLDTSLTYFSYDEVSSPGQLITSVTDRNGKHLTYRYDKQYQLIAFTNQNGESTGHTYDPDGNRLSTTDAMQRTSLFTYDANGNLVTAADPAGAVTSMAYDARNNLTSVTNVAGKKADFAYDARNNLLTAKNALNQTVTTTYNADSLPTQRTSARNGVTVYTYTQGLPISIRDPNNNTVTMAYDIAGRLTSVTDAAAKTRTMTYDVLDNVLSVKNPLNQTTTFTYDSRRRKLTESNALNQTTAYAYDGNGNLVLSTDPLGNRSRYTYDNEDRLHTIRNPRGGTVRMNYDPAGRLIATVGPSGETQTFGYNSAGERISAGDGRGNQSTTALDNRGLPQSTTDPNARTSATLFDNLRRLTRSTNALGQAVQLAYDDLDRLVSATDPLNQVSQQAYDADGNRTSITNARGGITSFAYDLGGRLTSVTVPGNRVTSYGYDVRNLLTNITEPSTQQTTLTYDDAGRLTRSTDPAGTIDYTYDAAGRLLTVKEGTPTLTRVYDVAGRLTQFTDGAGNVLKYAYDAAGNLTVLTYPDNKAVTYAYDVSNRPITVTDWSSRVTTYTYDPDGRLLTTTRPDGSVETRTWLPTGELGSVEDRKGATILAQYTYSYDLAGRIVTENPQPAPAAFVPVAFTAAYDTANRLTTFNTAAVTFDADGNMTNGPVVNGSGMAAFTYDSRNRLTGFGGVSYGYDAENRRISVTEAAGTTRFVVNPNARLSQVLSRTAPGGAVTRAVYGLGLLYEETGSTLRIPHYDYRGSAVAFTDASGNVTGRVDYGPYGELAARTGDTSTPFLFNGRYGVMTDSKGLYHMRARYYHPGVRRFVNQDVIIGSVETTATLNRFTYGGANPISFIDPEGHFIIQAIGLVVGGVAGGVSAYINGESIWVGALGGAAAGVIATVPGLNIYAASMLGGLGGGLVKGVANQVDRHHQSIAEYNRREMAEDFMYGGVEGLLGGAASKLLKFLPGIPGINQGRGSFEAIYNWARSMLANGRIKNLSSLTQAKIASILAYNSLPGLPIDYAVDEFKRWILEQEAHLSSNDAQPPVPIDLDAAMRMAEEIGQLEFQGAK